MNGKPMRLAQSALALSVAAVLAGCASLSDDGGFGSVATNAGERIGAKPAVMRSERDAAQVAALVNEKLAQPLTAEDAVQVAVINNRSLQAKYWEVGIAEAELVQAGRIENPGFSFVRTTSGDEVSYERTFTTSLINLITLPLSSRIEARRFEQARLNIVADIVEHAAQTRRAYFEAVAAEQGLAYARQVQSAAEASAELMARMAKVGNSSALDLAREEAFLADAVAETARSITEAAKSREELARLMGLWGAQVQFKLPAHLPDLPAEPLALPDLERLAVTERLDIQAARLHVRETASNLGLTRATRFVNVLELGYINGRSGEERETGYEISLEIPLFDWGSARTARAEATYMQAANELAQTAIEARSQARESYVAYRASYDLARHYRDRVIPLRKQIADETLLRYNGMLVGVFELLADAREQAEAVKASIDATKEFWIAQTDMQAAIGGKLSATGHTKEQQQ